ncbi:phosphatidate phosphatase LPIN3-like isoform X2 [Daphnia pulicaria]|uniref:phosphatidate phosphatase LPIN3-like isoform X2 n=1 Tax=Daphnia pulicaria TaxID=35523 RepID=UPI001EEA9AF3|nr:phosphatidate phosphatase LPIN3-like isoform X2 [Daphnia pulicaria]
MEYIWSLTRNFRELYNGINGATLTGAIDIVIVQQEDGTFLSSPFHVRFGKLGVLRSREKVVDIEINGNPVDIHMKLGESGEAFFVSESPIVNSDGQIFPPHMATSPIPPSLIEENKLRGINTAESSHEHMEDTLMGKRDEGMLAKTSDDIILGEDSSQGNFESIGIENAERSFKPIDPDHDAEAESLMPDFIEMTEEDRKRWRKKSRRRRSQLKKKMQREANKTSSESGTEHFPNEMEVGLEVSPAIGPHLAETSPVKPGHRKSHSLSGIQLKGDVPPPVGNPVEDWVRGGIISRSIGHEFHFFSDTEMEIRSPDGSRPPTPVHSDTEYEVGHMRPKVSELGVPSRNCHQQSWRWGELPSPPVLNRPSPPKPITRSSRDVSPSNPGTEAGAVATVNNETSDGTDNKARQSQSTAEAEAQRSMLSHMFSFMRQTKKMRHQGTTAGGGIYLDDLNVDSLDPELAALYITQSSFRHGLPDPAVARLRDEEDTESGKGASLPQSPHSLSTATAMRSSRGPRSIDSDFEDSRSDYRSLPDVALSLCGHFGDQIDPPDELFLQSLVTYDDFIENPRLIENPDLLVRIGNKYYTWQAACPIIMSWVLYQRFLPQSSVDAIVHEYMPKRKEKKTEPVAAPARKSSWFPWGRRSATKKESGEPEVNAAIASTTVQPEAASAIGPSSAPKTTESVVKKQKSDRQLVGDVATTGTSSDNESNDSNQPDSGKKLPMERRPYYENTDVFCKTLRLTSEQIRQLNLREGPNEAVFSVTTAYQGTTRCKCHIYLWRYDDKVVISDIDGTITKSDVLGHILPIVGQDWAQSGVAQLFTKIKNNGYRILYLSARAIGQAHITREYLRSVKQGDLSLPDGPLLLNPTSLLSAFHREVIEKKPEEFKISCLRDIQMLFPSHSNPFYAGYGNRVNDVWAYRAVGIPTSRIFTINPRGELKLELPQAVQSSYSKQSFIVDLVFPPFLHGTREILEGSEYSEFTYWRQPVPDTPDEVEAAKFITAYSDSNKQRRTVVTKSEH